MLNKLSFPPHKTLVVVDAFCIIYKAIAAADKYNLTGDAREAYIKRACMWVQSGAMFPGLMPRVVWAVDSDRAVTPYWRTEVFPEYKANRPPRKAEGVEIAGRICKAFPSIIVPGFEADDVAAELVKAFNVQEYGFEDIDKMILLTVDSDWMGLVNRHVAWANVNTHAPRVRGHVESYHWFAGKHMKQSKRKQRLFDMPVFSGYSPTSIWDWKSNVGDRADNLPEGSDISLIDLFNPPYEYEIVRADGFVDQVGAALAGSIDMKVKLDGLLFEIERRFLETGMRFPIEPVSLEIEGGVTAEAIA